MARPELETLTAELAYAAGIPVFVWCSACASPSRQLSLDALRKRGLAAQPIAALAAAKRFRCTMCGKRSLEIMPTLDLLVIQRRRLRITCLRCNKDQSLTARAAVERFGLAMPFDVLRRSLRCHTSCGVTAGAMIDGEMVDRNARPVFTDPPAARTRASAGGDGA